jgi:hypothetical protein
MWEPYLKVIREKYFEALHYSRPFPYRRRNEQSPRRSPRRRIAPHGERRPDTAAEEVRWLLLKGEENLKVEQRFRLRDLVIDAVYVGGTKGNTADDVLGKLIPGAGNQGGFRAVGSWDAPRLVLLYSSMDDPDWPDFIDVYTGVFTYFRDNKKPGFDLHDTPRRGNKLLQSCFAILHNAPDQRAMIPLFLVFTKGSKGRDAVFRGLAVPGVEADPADDLVAIWRSKKGERFQNYRAKFTILDTGKVSREWIEAVKAGEPLHTSASAAWRTWVERGVYEPLTAEPTIEYRTKEEQQPGAGPR